MKDDARSGMQLRDYARVVARRWLVVAAVAAIVTVTLTALSLMGGASYRSTASVLINPTESNPYDQTLDLLRQVSVATEEELVTSSDVVAFVADRLDLELADASALAKRVAVANPIDTLVLQISCRDGSASQAQACADAFADGYLDVRGAKATERVETSKARLEADLARQQDRLDVIARELAQAGGGERNALLTQQQLLVRQVQGIQDDLRKVSTVSTDPGRKTVAAKPAKDEGRSLLQMLLVSLLIGLVLGVIAAFVVENFDDRVLDPRDVERVSGLELIGVVRDAGSYREARSVIAARAPDTRRILVCAASDNTVLDVTCDLAVAFAGLDRHVLVVVGEPANPRAVEALGVPMAPGLAELAAGRVSPFAATHPAPAMARISVLPAGSGGASLSELVATAKGREAINYVSSGFDVTLFSAGAAQTTGSVDIAAACEGVVLVATLQTTRLRDIEAALDKLERLNAPLLGVLVRHQVGAIQRPGRAASGVPGAKAPSPSVRRSA